MISTESRELILQLLDDIGVIEAQFEAGEPKPAVARTVFVPILRRWFVEQLFYQAQRLILPQQVEFEVMVSETAISLCQKGDLEEWMELVIFKGIGVASAKYNSKFILGGNLVLPDEIRKADHNPKLTTLRAKRFSKQKMFYWKEKFYTREDIIKMHANRLGGVHFDFPGDDEKHIEEIKNSHGYDVVASQIKMLLADDVSRTRANPAQRERIYDATELVAIDSARVFATAVRKNAESFMTLME